ncbi:hypothetical protein GLOIN_2v1826118 [Rhizophagus irregularis DAOM 181602=DAOM 197198]|uniref:Serine-threonine/tyrosine-protein kinase catalytic domain-containing protein n=1 Tax=Rhizophagus irregularis (strain DAOM 181602 / DAOM 197198 / MUCL 43194) TaxID=747089 RepID=A0A2P4Q9E5_RHIID|nr:hypothetical protein GLOIN_2v1826118 [Rhizophagus irregularis DAOM 181602=DAOM 197198]POG74264.1 hypothetical protein GLOIN_2v1826118 [Rhizophagus irregularis DAOM 181602=DAOM 197198]|eukprot:XP_025181130.1 hypothetical protein GLOIN_2v1826118 [Rhizophagus irregularis DAOM 181602=DAOM 197198]
MSEMNEWSKWLDEAVTKKHIKHYEYEYFKNIQVIGFVSFGKVYRAKWKNSYQYFALKSLHNIDEDAIKELVHERIEASTKKKKELFGVVSMDPKKFGNKSFSLNKKSDIYGESYDGCLAVQIMQGLTIPDTPIEYVKLYTECWDDNPNNRPSIQEAVERLNTISSLTNIPIYQQNENIDKITDKKKKI